MIFKFLATCNPGLEEIAIKEVEELIGIKAKFFHPGAIIFDSEEKAIFKLNFLSRSLHRIILLFHFSEFIDLNDIYSKTVNLDLTDFIHFNQSFAIRAERFGKHNFTSIDVARVVGQAIIDNYLKNKNHRLKVNLDNPDIEIRCEVRNSLFWIGIDTTGESLHKRWYRIIGHKAPLKSTIAYSMVRLSNWKINESLCDPMCGIGTIPIEAAIWANNIPIGKFRKFNFEKFNFINREDYINFIEKHQCKNESLCITGIDISMKSINGAKKNAEKAGVKINFINGDSTKIPLEYDHIITDLPYGIRTKRKNLKELYRDFFNHVYKYNWKSLVVITAKPEFIPSIEPVKVFNVEYGNICAKIFLFKS
ncbi:MAG: tRNA (guanine(6)-N2)-methyltransferase [Nitrososphaerota archaeon]